MEGAVDLCSSSMLDDHARFRFAYVSKCLELDSADVAIFGQA